MKRPLAALLTLLLILPSLAFGQSVKMPDKLSVEKGRLGAVTVSYEGSDIRWVSSPGLDVFREYDPDSTKIRLRVIGYKDSTETISAVACSKDGKLSDFVTCTVTVGTPTPTPPGPTPPGPNPPDPPTPTPGTNPIDAPGFRVLIVEKVADRAKLPAKQLAVLFDAKVRDYLNTHCADNGNERAIWDIGSDTSQEPKLWQDAMKRAKDGANKTGKLPYILVSNGDKKIGYEGPLPATVEDTLALLKKIAEPPSNSK